MRNLRRWVRQNLGLGQLGEGVIQLLAYGVSFFLVSYVIGYLKTPSYLRDIKKGYSAISSDWKAFKNDLEKGNPDSSLIDGQRAIVRYLPEENLRELYQARASLYERFARDEKSWELCNEESLANAPEKKRKVIKLMPRETYRLTGRAFALRRIGAKEWIPPVDLTSDDGPRVFGDLIDAFERLEGAGAAEFLRRSYNSETVSPYQLCRGLQEFYGISAKYPNERVAWYRLIDVARSVDHLGSQ